MADAILRVGIRDFEKPANAQRLLDVVTLTGERIGVTVSGKVKYFLMSAEDYDATVAPLMRLTRARLAADIHKVLARE
jgi:hypothetical protein